MCSTSEPAILAHRQQQVGGRHLVLNLDRAVPLQLPVRGAPDGGTGTLVVTQDDARVSGAYTGDASLGGTLRFALTSSTTARVETGQALQTACTIPMGRGIPSPTPQPLPVTAGLLTLVGAKLFVSSCANARVAGTLICSK